MRDYQQRHEQRVDARLAGDAVVSIEYEDVTVAVRVDRLDFLHGPGRWGVHALRRLVTELAEETAPATRPRGASC